MGLLNEAHELQAKTPGGGRRCILCALSDPAETELRPKSDATELAEAFATSAITANVIVRVLAGRGVKTGVNNVQRHRREHVPTWSPQR